MTLQAGALGAMIQVRNIDSGKVIVGLVQADGSVRVGGR
jgi:flagella basal body P-ring formation protein FlgA